VMCFAKAYNSGIYETLFNGNSRALTDWTAYGGIGGTVNDNASCTSQIAGELVCGVVAVTDAAFYANVYNGTSWSGWLKVGGSGVGTPSCAPFGTGRVVCLVHERHEQAVERNRTVRLFPSDQWCAREGASAPISKATECDSFISLHE